MRLILMLTLLSCTALAQGQVAYEDRQPATLDPPASHPNTYPAGLTRPLLLGSATTTAYTSFRVTVCPDPGESLLGTGTIRLYLFVPNVGGTGGRWTANSTADLGVTMTTPDICQTYGRKVDVSAGYLLPATQGVSDSGGGGVIIRVDPGKN